MARNFARAIYIAKCNDNWIFQMDFITKSTFSDKEKALLESFKLLIKDEIRPHQSDHYFSRFLIAGKWDMKVSVELFINEMKLREKEQIDDILETFPQHYWFKTLHDYWPTSINHKFFVAKDGSPVIYGRIGIFIVGLLLFPHSS